MKDVLIPHPTDVRRVAIYYAKPKSPFKLYQEMAHVASFSETAVSLPLKGDALAPMTIKRSDMDALLKQNTLLKP